MLPANVRRLVAIGVENNCTAGTCDYGRTCNICIYEALPEDATEREATYWAEGIVGFGPAAADLVLSLLMSERFA